MIETDGGIATDNDGGIIGGLGNIGRLIAHRSDESEFITSITNTNSYFDILPTDFDIDETLGFSRVSDGVFAWTRDYNIYAYGEWIFGGSSPQGGNKICFLDTKLNGGLLGQNQNETADSLTETVVVPWETNLSKDDEINLSVRNSL